jgi:hypothetical protein
MFELHTIPILHEYDVGLEKIWSSEREPIKGFTGSRGRYTGAVISESREFMAFSHLDLA